MGVLERIGAATVMVLGMAMALSAVQSPAVREVGQDVLREYAGVYRWESNAFVSLQLWNEFVGFDQPGQLVSFDDSGEVRTLYPTDRDRFFAGPGMAVPTTIESRVEFQRNGNGQIVSLSWRRPDFVLRHARRVEIERRETVRFSNGDIRLAGTMISPMTGGKHPAVVLVHGSGAQNRESILPWARFLIRRGMVVLGYDKRGVGESTGDWNMASFDDLAGDVVAAFEYLKTRSDIDGTQIGLLGISQAGWIMPLAAVRSKDMAFLISLSGAGVPAAETTLDQAQNEMTMTGMPPQTVEQIIALLKLQYAFARSGQGWDAYRVARDTLVAKMGPAPKTIPGTPEDPYWQFIRRLYFYDPAPTLRQLQTPTLALWGALDNNILAEKNHGAWEAALSAGGNRDHTLRILPNANHAQWEAKVGSNAEMKSLQRFVPAYFTIIEDWLVKRVRGFERRQ
jgi:uncharacterized protein